MLSPAALQSQMYFFPQSNTPLMLPNPSLFLSGSSSSIIPWSASHFCDCAAFWAKNCEALQKVRVSSSWKKHNFCSNLFFYACNIAQDQEPPEGSTLDPFPAGLTKLISQWLNTHETVSIKIHSKTYIPCFKNYLLGICFFYLFS